MENGQALQVSSKVAKKILAVMSDVQAVKKDKRNEFHKYDYASDEAVVTEIRNAMIKHALIVIPSQTSCRREVMKTNSGESGITEVCQRYLIVDVDSGESQESQFYGQGQDSGDKGVYKAATGAEKYFLLKTFLIPTGDDPENENGKSNGKSAVTPKVMPRSVPVAHDMPNDAQEPISDSGPSWPHPAEEEKQKPGCISLKQSKRFYAIAKNAGRTDKDIKLFLWERIKSGHTMDIPWKKYEQFCEEITQYVPTPMPSDVE